MGILIIFRRRRINVQKFVNPSQRLIVVTITFDCFLQIGGDTWRPIPWVLKCWGTEGCIKCVRNISLLSYVALVLEPLGSLSGYINEGIP